MKKLLYLILAFSLGSCSSKVPSTLDYSPDQYLGQWVVINYWAQWCKPCIEEIPELNRLDETYSGVVVLGVNYDGATAQELANQIASLNIQFTTLISDPHAVLEVPRPAVLPTTFIIDPSGKLHKTLVGPQTLSSLATATQQQSPAE